MLGFAGRDLASRAVPPASLAASRKARLSPGDNALARRAMRSAEAPTLTGSVAPAPRPPLAMVAPVAASPTAASAASSPSTGCPEAQAQPA